MMFKKRKEKDAVTADTSTEVVDENGNAEASIREDQLGVYPKDIDVPALAERRYLWIVRVFAIALGISMTLNIALAYLATTVFPMKQIEPFLVTFKDSNQQLVQVLPMRRTVQGFDIMTEGLIRQYITLMEEITPNAAVMSKKWGAGSYLQIFSNPQVYAKFQQRTLPALKEFLDRKWSRAVKIIDLEQAAPGYWNITYETEVFDDLGEPVLAAPQQWVASMTIQFAPKNVSYQKALLNPLGFTVSAFGIRQKT